MAGLLLQAAAVAMPAPAAATVVAFGDSITDATGFDDPSQPEPGYPYRLERLLLESGLAVDVRNDGKGGEDTTQGITRLETVLVDGDAMLLLMEGTNDISREISPETTLFNLDEMAARAEERGMVVVHATLIPRWPQAKIDPENELNGGLAADIRELAAERGRPLVDPFAEFFQLPKLFQDYYTQRDTDPVGHPNAAGFQVLAEIFHPLVLADYPRLAVDIAVPEEIVAGEPVQFSAVIEGEAESTRWIFSDGGFAYGGGGDFDAEYFFTEPGTYEVRVEVTDRFGRVTEASETVEVEDAEVTTFDRESFVQAVSVGGAEGATGCTLLSTGDELALVELSFVARGSTQALPLRKVALPQDRPLLIDDLLGELFALDTAEGSFHVRSRGLAATPEVDLLCRTLTALEEPVGGTYGHLVGVDDEATWSAAPKRIAGLLQGSGFSTTLRAINLDEVSGTISATLYDGTGAVVGGPVSAFKLSARAMRLRRLVDVFPQVKSKPGTYTVLLAASGVRFLASATVAETTSKDTFFLPAPAPRSEHTLHVPRVVRGQGWPSISQTTRLVVHNPSTLPTALTVDLLAKSSKTAPAVARPQVALTVAANQTLVFDDALRSLFGRDEVTGSLRVTWSNDEEVAPQVRAIVLATKEGFRYGYAVDAVGADARVRDLGQVFGAEQSSTEKSNFGVVNLAGGRTGLQLRLRTPGGLTSATARISLAAGQHYERNLAGIFPGIGKGAQWLLEVDVLQGGPVLPYLLRSNVTGDAFLLPFEPVD